LPSWNLDASLDFDRWRWICWLCDDPIGILELFIWLLTLI
jgi:hypothetical protein